MSLRSTPTGNWKGGFPGRKCLGVFWQAALFLLLGTVIARGATASETEVKSSFLYNVAKFVEWPADAFTSTNAPIQVAVYGDTAFSAELKNLLKDKKAHGRSFEVKTITSPQEVKTSHIVFVASSESRRAPQVLETTKKLPILTIGESDEFLDQGGIINLLFEDAQLGFEINPEPAEKVKLEISSKLLRLGKKRSPK